MKNLLLLYRLAILLFALTLAATLYLTWRDGAKTGPWLLSAGLFFLVLFIREIRNKSK